MGLGDALKFTVGLDMRPAEVALIEFRTKAENIGRTLGMLKGAAVGIGAGIGGALAGGAKVLESVLFAGSEMETFESRLTTLMGSSDAARSRLGELFDFAATTPFEVGPIVAAETTLRGFGAAAEEIMPGLIDFAATTGADLAQSAIDFGKAWNQGATGLESDFGKILRKQIELREGMDATKMEIGDFRAAMLETLNEGMFKGGADRLSKTFGGMVSNLKDEWGRFTLQVADAGVFNNVKGALSQALEIIGKNRSETVKWAGAVSDGLWLGFRSVAMLVAGMVDAGRGVKLFIDAGTVAAGEFVNVTASGLRDINFALADAARLAGADGLADSYDMVGNQLNRAAMGAQDLANNAKEGVLALQGQATAVDEMRALLDDAEKRGQGMGSALADILGGAGSGAAAGRGGGDADKEREKALAFLEQLRSMNRTAEEEEDARYQKQLEQLDTLKFGTEAWAEAVELIHENHEAVLDGFARERYEKERAYLDELEKEKQAQAERDKQRQRDYASTLIGSTQSLLSTISGMLDEENAKQKAAHKALAIAQIGISTAVGIAKAFEQYGWPAGIIPAALTAGEGAAQIAAVASAHQGRSFATIPGDAPDERRVRVLASEAMLNTQATRMLGEQGVNALNGGMMPGAREVVVNIGRTQSREILREEKRSNGPMARFTRDLFGVASAGDRDVGFSGRRAVA